MSRGFYSWHPSLLNRRLYADDLPLDPRAMMAMHIGWSRVAGQDTQFHTPEPDNFNRVIMADKAVHCEFIENNVFYRDLLRDKWWTFYYVPAAQLPKFDAWLLQQNYELLWKHPRAAAVRPRRNLLWNRQSAPELNLNERLYTMGYFDELQRKYFSEDSTMLTTRLGPLRQEVTDALQNISQQV